MIDPFVGVATLINGLVRTHKLDSWARLLLSMSATAFVTFFGAFSSVGLASLAGGQPFVLAFAWALFSASGTMAAVVFFVWSRSPLTKGIPISAPGSVVEAQNKILRDETIVTMGGQK